MKNLLISVLVTLAGSSAFAGACELRCAGEQLACARYATSDLQQGMCRFAYNVCMRDCGTGSFVNQSFQQLLDKTTIEVNEGYEVEYF